LTAEHAPKFIRAIKSPGNQYGFEYSLENLPTVQMMTAGATPGDSDVITFRSRINLLETF
jgi:hypothetical protein